MSSTKLNGQADEGAVGISNLQILGEVAWLYANSPIHLDWPFNSIHQWITPPLQKQQFRVFRDKDQPVAYVSWAWMSDEAEKRYLQNTGNLKPDDWKSGEKGWIIDLVAPFGHGKMVMKYLKNDLFTSNVGRALRIRPDSEEAHVMYLHGSQATQKLSSGEIRHTDIAFPNL